MAKKKATKKVSKKVTKKVTKKTAKKATKKVAVKAAKKAVKKTAKKVAKKAVKKAAKTMTKKVAVKAAPKKQSTAVVSQTVKVGDTAPDFTLPDQNGNHVSLHDFKGKNVVIYFYPKAMTPGCTVQACSLRDAKAELAANNIVVFGISADPVKMLKKFEEKDKLNFTLLSDESKEVIKSYGSWGTKQFMGKTFDGILRQSFLINADGKIVHIMNKVDTKSHHDDILNFFKNQ